MMLVALTWLLPVQVAAGHREADQQQQSQAKAVQ